MSDKFIQIDRQIITQIADTTEAVVLSYIIHEQISSLRNNNCLRNITAQEIAAKFGINKKTASRVKTKLFKKNLLVEDSPIPNPRIGKLVWNEGDKCFDINFTKIVKTIGFYGKEVETGRIYNYITPVNETTHYFDYGFIKVDKEWFLNPEIDITTKYWIMFFKAFEPNKSWKPTFKGISKEAKNPVSCWSTAAIKKEYYRLCEEKWIHNDGVVDITTEDYKIIKTKLYSVDFKKEEVC